MWNVGAGRFWLPLLTRSALSTPNKVYIVVLWENNTRYQWGNYNDGYHAVMEDSKGRLSVVVVVVTAEPKLLIINQNIPPNERISPQRREAANRRFLLSQRWWRGWKWNIWHILSETDYEFWLSFLEIISRRNFNIGSLSRVEFSSLNRNIW